MKILNLYAGIGGNRKGWKLQDGDHVVAVEYNKKIANIYKHNFPNDEVIVADAHDYLLEHFREFDFIWSSPPCPSHSIIRKQLAFKKRKDGTLFEQNKPLYPDMRLYQEIILLEHYFNGYYCVENVISYYTPLIDCIKIGRHYFWANFPIRNIQTQPRGSFDSIQDLSEQLGFDTSFWRGVDKILLLRNCVESEVSERIFQCLKEYDVQPKELF